MINRRFLFALIVIVGTFILNLQDLNFYPQLSQGDHGRDLYSAQAVLRGEAVYKDFWWVYGPLMPYYFAFFYKFFGMSVASFLLGYAFMKSVCAALFFLAASVWIAPSVACLAAFWFAISQQDFFFTFNHIGGIACGLWVLYLLFSYIKNPRLTLLYWLFGALTLFSLIKINFGLAAWVSAMATVFLTDWSNHQKLSDDKKKWWIGALCLFPLIIALIYWFCLRGLPLYAVRQCMPYFGDDQPHHFSPLVTIPYYFTQHWLTLVNVPLQRIFALFLHGATLLFIFLIISGRITGDKRKHMLLSLFALGLLFILNFHEFVVSGVWYRTYWSLPYLYMFHFCVMAWAFQVLHPNLRQAIWLCFWAFIVVVSVSGYFSTQQAKIPPRYLSGEHGKVFIGNETEWTKTVNLVAAFLTSNLKDDETFLALPYDDIYYFLTNKPSPTRQLIFFDHIHIPPQQEISIINELTAKKVKYVLISNRMSSPETGLGTFGTTYCPLLSAYIAQNYRAISRLGGDWNTPPGWGHNHGVMILEKN